MINKNVRFYLPFLSYEFLDSPRFSYRLIKRISLFVVSFVVPAVVNWPGVGISILYIFLAYEFDFIYGVY